MWSKRAKSERALFLTAYTLIWIKSKVGTDIIIFFFWPQEILRAKSNRANIQVSSLIWIKSKYYSLIWLESNWFDWNQIRAKCIDNQFDLIWFDLIWIKLILKDTHRPKGCINVQPVYMPWKAATWLLKMKITMRMNFFVCIPTS